ncbi:hypothetical protein KBW71_11380 [Hydrogenophaga aromaticivorans]|uniref:hypothetical protein n=1 Tax=Hydrogenophaga aromaticivorans TaxID=2610898 RepID=UPI001B37A4C0|nr:hypothetical protein [Hydrogenophaga aromaticivorans]MBQ0919038.1 hypothetical protein [Hydrogenophaga aromaticivorans]
MKKLMVLFAFLVPGLSMAQWAVYDEAVYKELYKINEVLKLENGRDKLDGDFKGAISSSSSSQDVTLGAGSNQAILKGLDTKFETITVDNADKYIGTEQDCGSNDPKFLKHYNACAGLRNLRLQTLKQSQDMLKVLNKRREQIVKLVEASRGVSDKSGQMQRYHFELQAQQSLLQTDAMQLQVLMDGYKQREKTYEMQMVEAKRERDTGRFDAGKGALRKPSVPFVMP